MDDFRVEGGRLTAERVPVAAIAAAAGTPVYVYSLATLLGHIRRLRDAFAPLRPEIRYALKANGNLALLAALAKEGCGFDVVSRGEIFRVLRAGGDPAKIDFAGVGKRRDEMEAALDAGIAFFNVESEGELDLLGEVAREKGVEARVALRVNPDVDPKTHRHISTGKRGTKFGLDVERVRAVAASFARRAPLVLRGLHCHIGSQILETEPHRQAVSRVLDLARELRETIPTLDTISVGGGFGIHYRGEEAPPISAFADALVPLLDGAGFHVHMEPGRLLVGNAGILVTRVLYVTDAGDRRFVIVDAAMNDLLRPSLYEAYHRIEPVERRPGAAWTVDVVGPVCETGDFLARDRELPPVEPGDLLAVRSAGAYGFSMAGNYNARPRPAEVVVDGARFGIARERETLDDLVRGEHTEPRWL